GAPAGPRDVAMTIPADPKPSQVKAVTEITPPAVESVRTIPAKSSGRGVRVRPAVFENDLQANNNQPDAFSKVYNQKTKEYLKLGRSFGIDPASVNLTKLPVDAPSPSL